MNDVNDVIGLKLLCFLISHKLYLQVDFKKMVDLDWRKYLKNKEIISSIKIYFEAKIKYRFCQ